MQILSNKYTLHNQFVKLHLNNKIHSFLPIKIEKTDETLTVNGGRNFGGRGGARGRLGRGGGVVGSFGRGRGSFVGRANAAQMQPTGVGSVNAAQVQPVQAVVAAARREG